MLNRFAVEYQQYHGMSEERCGLQLKELRAFAEFAGKDSPELCDEQDLRRYLSHLVGLGIHINTVRKRANYIRPFFSWCYEAGVIPGERLMAIRSISDPKGATGRTKPKPYSAKELRKFWAELDERWPFVEEKWFIRWREGRSRYKRIATHVMRLQIEAIVSLALDCGLRQTEILSLDLDDMHYDNEYVVVKQRAERENGKDSYREAPFTEEARTHVRNWVELRTELAPPHDRPWISAFANQAEGGWLQPMQADRMKRLLRTVGDWRLHRFRHTCATNWLRAGMDLEVLSRMIGHSNISQTLAYAEIVRDDIQRQVERNEGRFRLMTVREKVAS